MIRVVKAAIRAASRGGKTWEYFQKEQSWEAPMRSVFSWITPAIIRDPKSARCHATVLLFAMGNWYKAIWPNTRINYLSLL